MDIPDTLQPFRRFASSCANVRVTAGGVTFHWFDWYYLVWAEKGLTFTASARRGSEPIVECYGSEELVWKWVVTRIGAYTRYCMRYPAITPPHTSEAPPTGIHLTGNGINLDIAPGIPAFLNTDLDTLVTAYMSPTGGPLRDLTDFKTWEADPMGKGFFPSFESFNAWQNDQGRSVRHRHLNGFALDENNRPVPREEVYSPHPENPSYIWFDGQVYGFETSSRAFRRLEFTTPDFGVLTRLILLLDGEDLRSLRMYAPLDIPYKLHQVPSGWMLERNLFPQTDGITDPSGNFIPASTGFGRMVEYAQTISLSPEQLFNAFCDPWGGMLHHYLDETYWLTHMYRRLRDKECGDYKYYEDFLREQPWYIEG
ncbi:hypothetical protein [Schaalia sp. Marseille-Q2122]|uniref:hypothetical protein n=1 Tax=Schaalia sp. Marseille-Q2122 TaxID=2736604 RepID=UPI00158C6975|nr:hypothetical protein [Schaalia sp. Marseille-Q2122]